MTPIMENALTVQKPMNVSMGLIVIGRDTRYVGIMNHLSVIHPLMNYLKSIVLCVPVLEDSHLHLIMTPVVPLGAVIGKLQVTQVLLVMQRILLIYLMVKIINILTMLRAILL